MSGSRDLQEAELRELAVGSLLGDSSVITVVLDSDMIVQWASPSASSVGVAPVGRSVVELVHADDLDRVATTFSVSAVDGDRSSLMTNVVIPLRVVTPSRNVPFEATGRWVRTRKGVWYFVVALVDVTTRFATTEALRAIAGESDDQSAVQVLVDACRTFNGIDGAQVMWWSPEGERFSVGDLGSSPEIADHLVPVDGELGALGSSFSLVDYDWAHVFPITGAGEMLGAFGFWGWGPPPEIRFLSVVVAPLLDLAALALTRARAQASLSERANTDPLTGLANRRHFMDQFPVQHNESVAVMYIDLDNFKTVNDFWGHSTGDRVLELVAERIRHAVSKGDVVARLGGDEFAVLCRWIRPAAAPVIADRVVEALNRSYDIDGVRVPGGASVGVAVGTRRSAGPDLVDRADRALMLAKAEGKARLVLASDTE